MATHNDIETCLGTDVAKYAANKQRGGSNGNKGTRYEDFFMVHRIAQEVAAIIKVPTYPDPHVQGQCTGLVDDLRVASPQATQYYQLKNKESVSWNAGDHPIAKDFAYQKKLSDYLNEPNPNTTLIVADSSQASDLLASVPADIGDHTDVEHFPWFAAPNRLVLELPELRENLSALSHIDNPTDDVLSGVFGMLLMACLNLPEGAKASEIAQTAAKQVPGQLRPLPATQDWESYLTLEFKLVLDAIHGLVYSIKRGVFHWSGFGTSGVFRSSVLSEEFKQFQNDIVQREPKTFEDFEGVLP